MSRLEIIIKEAQSCLLVADGGAPFSSKSFLDQSLWRRGGENEDEEEEDEEADEEEQLLVFPPEQLPPTVRFLPCLE